MIVDVYLDSLCARYLEHHITKNTNGQLEFKRQWYLYSYLVGLLSPDVKFNDRVKPIPGKTHISFKIGYNDGCMDNRSFNHFLSVKNQTRLNTFIRGLIKQEVCSYVSGYVSGRSTLDISDKEKLGIKKAIYQYLEEYSFPKPELEYESLKKMIYRQRIRQNQGAKTVHGLLSLK